MLETPTAWLILILIGICTGILSGLLGIGGGLLMVPALTLFGVPLVEATATSLVGVFLSAVSGSLRNLSARELNWRVSLLLAAFGIFTAQLGAGLGDRLPDQALSLAFAALLLLNIYLMNLRQRLKHQSDQHNDLETSPVQSLSYEATLTTHPPTTPLLPIAIIGLLSGFLSGLLGVGGGLVMVPLQMLFLGESIKAAVRTSLGAIVAIAISGLAQHTWNDNVLWLPGLCLGLGGIFGAQIGSRLLPKLSDRRVNQLFRVFLMGLAVYMVVRAI
ncbi:MAG: sulfite exporter TauE/SafE family protein [Oculatellaceae cyanobacterium Prado106]|jgi:hypothetical protein|nr:sulfite exporter TauE/SafE family protein [Oculatellaceae cyanobacterium Prado106]